MSDVPTAQDSHPLGPLASLAASASEWRTREATGGGTTWAGLWHTGSRGEVLQMVEQHAIPLDAKKARQLSKAGHLPGVRSFSNLVAWLPTASRDLCCDTNATKDEEAEGGNEEPPPGVPIFDHGEFEQARLSQVQHVTHLTRYLDDFHEPTLAALRRRLLRKVEDADDPLQRQAASEEAADQFLEEPVRWRDVVELAIHISAVRAIEGALGTRIKGPGRTTAELADKISVGLTALAMAQAFTDAQRIGDALADRLARLEASTVVLMYEEHRYLQLSGVVGGKSVRRHLPRGLHLVFSDQSHRREDRIAGLWLAASGEHDQVGPYYYAPAVPETYAARKKRDSFRLVDADAVHRYVQREPEG